MITPWRADPISFIERIIIDPETGKPFILLDAERRFLEHAFSTNPPAVCFIQSRFIRVQRNQQTTFAAIYVLTMVLLCDGAYPEAICAANDHDQSIARVFAAIKRIIECSPLLRAEARITANKITIDGAVIIAIPNKAPARPAAIK